MRAFIVWQPAWRPDQKEREARTLMASKAVEEYFHRSSCFPKADILHPDTVGPVGEKIEAARPTASDAALLSEARRRGAGRLIVMRVEELGPNVMLYCSPVLWATRNDVDLRVRVLDVASGELEADVALHWERGGPFTLNTPETLTGDMVEALTALFGR